MRITRRTLLSASLLLACKKQSSSSVFIDPALAMLVPADAVFLIGIRMEKLQATPFYKEHLVKQRPPALNLLAERTGIDPLKDVWEYLVETDPRGTCVLTRGKFAEMGMEPKMNSSGAERFGYKGLTFIGDQRTAVAFLNPSTAMAGPVAALKYVIDHRNDTAGLPAPLQSRIGNISAANQIWFAGSVIPAMQALPLGRVNPSTMLRSLSFLSGGIDFHTGAKGYLLGETATVNDANGVRDALRGLIGMARLSTPTEQTALLRAYDGFRVEAEGANVRVDFTAGNDVLDEAMRLIMPPGT